jgi:SNF2 family DNA or RNA helicase
MDADMAVELGLTPAHHIIVVDHADEANDDSAAVPRQWGSVTRAFAVSQAAGLVALAARQLDALASPTCTYWRDYASRYLRELCHTPESVDVDEAIAPPPQAELVSMLLRVPPMRGAEYLSIEGLTEIWRDLDAWVRRRITAGGAGLSGFLQEHAPAWHQVGRVSFHLAENKRDPDCPFAFLATYAVGVSAASRIQYQPLSKALQQYAGAKNRKALIHLLSPVERAAQASELIRKLVDAGDIYQPLAWTPAEAYRFLREVPCLEESGILVRLPDWWKKRPRPRVGVTIGERSRQSLDAASMLDFHVHIALGEQELSLSEWESLLASEDGLVLLKGQWVEVDRQQLQQALDHWKRVEQQATDGISFIEGMRLLSGAPMDLDTRSDDADTVEEWSFVEAGLWLREVLDELRGPRAAKGAIGRRDLKATLRPYQEVGVAWLSFVSGLGLGACLADDMGLGKTIQVLALWSELKNKRPHKPSLLVLPASLLGNWNAEIQRFTPHLRVCFLHPAQTGQEDLQAIAADPRKLVESMDVVATTYSMLLRQPWLNEVAWRLVVLDEAQAIKNPAARQTKAVKRLKADAKIALTGTPVENRLADLWSLFDFLCPGLLGTQTRFREFVKQLASDRQYGPLRKLVQPYILRRLKTDKRVISDLPEKTEVRAYCGLGRRQAVLYEKLVRELAKSLQGVDGVQRRGAILAYLLRFKQVCNHPSQLLGDGEYDPAASGKFARLAELCQEIASRQEKVLVFTQFREIADPLAGYLSGIFERHGLILHGGTAVAQRKKLVDAFQRDDGPPFFVLSLKAGGTGLNLTAACHVIHFDRWWNPAVENQATDRAFRIGQQHNVLVHKFVCQGTVEERIDALIEEKSQLADAVLAEGTERTLTEMSDEELIRMVSLDLDRATMQGA